VSGLSNVDVMDNSYKIVSVEPTDPPADTVGKGWHCYIIQQGKNTIRGYKRGDFELVTQAVEEIVARLNERRYGKIGYIHLVMSSQSKKAEQQ
jgi:hypothetical protein